MFPNFKITCPADLTEESKVLINNHLTSLSKQFSFYFQEQKMLIDLSCDSTLKQMIQQENNIVTFWLRVTKDFPTLTNKTLEILLPFGTSFLFL